MTRVRARNVAAFVSPHGFGHAARSSAVMASARREAGIDFHVFSTVPKWFFAESLDDGFTYHPVECDVGFRQTSALHVDLEATVRALERLVPFEADRIDRLAAEVTGADCRAVLCDIAPLGIAVAERAGIPSLLLENFSWPWLYSAYADSTPRLGSIASSLRYWDERATVHVQTAPVCARDDRFELVEPIAREATLERHDARRALGVDDDRPIVVLTMGGFGEAYPFLERLRERPDIVFVVTGAAGSRSDANLRLFDNDTPLFMPNLLRAADAMIAKLGYGTVAEVWREGLPWGWVTRPDFPEMPPLAAFARSELQGMEIGPDDFLRGRWIGDLDELLERPRTGHGPGGAARVAQILSRLVQ